MFSVKKFRQQQKRFKSQQKQNLSFQSNEKDSILQLEAKLYKSVKIFLLISEIFISAPTNAHCQHQHGGALQRTLQALHILWNLVVYTVISCCVYIQYTQSNIDLPTVQKPLYFCEYLVYLIHIFHLIVSTYWARQKYRDFIRTIVEFDYQLITYDRSAYQPKYNAFATFLNVHLFLIALHFTCTAIIDYYYSGRLILVFLRSTTVYTLPNVILHVSLAQYYVLLYAIALRSVDLNYILRLELSKVESGESSTMLQENLQKIRRFYSTLQMFTKQVTEAFGQSVVLIYIGSYMNISVNIFLIYKYLDRPETSDLAWIMYSVVWTCMHICKMFLILYYNYCVQNQKNTTALLLNDIKGRNPEMEETITHFILQLIINTRSNVVCGVAELNMDFIASLLVAISTLFIFLLQYDITFEALTSTHNSASPT